MIEAVIFDMDGVIIDSEPIYFAINQQIFQNLALDITAEDYGSFVGTTNYDMWAIIKNKYNLKPTVNELLEVHSQKNMEHFGEIELVPISGLLDLLNIFEQQKIKMGVASSSPLNLIELILKKCKLTNFFEIVVSGDNVKNGKPAPDIFLLAAKNLGVTPRNCLVIEDAARGVQAAKAAGMKCIGFQNKNSYNQDLSKADIIVDNYQELDLEVLKQLIGTY